MRIVGLSFPIRPHFRWPVEPRHARSHARSGVFQSTVLTIGCHAYTHVDAPIHFLPGDRDIASKAERSAHMKAIRARALDRVELQLQNGVPDLLLSSEPALLTASVST